jgi:hypothetical protein
MSSFLKVYNNIRNELLSEKENIEKDEIQSQPIEGMDDTQDNIATQDQENASVSSQLDSKKEISTLKEDEKALIDKNWIDKIVTLLNFLNKDDTNVKEIISKLTENTDNIKNQKLNIEELLNSIPPEKKS